MHLRVMMSAKSVQHIYLNISPASARSRRSCNLVRDKTLTSAFRCFGRIIFHEHEAGTHPRIIYSLRGASSSLESVLATHFGAATVWCLVARFIHLIGIKHLFADYPPVDSPEEARPEASVARRFNLIHLYHKRVRVTVN